MGTKQTAEGYVCVRVCAARVNTWRHQSSLFLNVFFYRAALLEKQVLVNCSSGLNNVCGHLEWKTPRQKHKNLPASQT